MNFDAYRAQSSIVFWIVGFLIFLTPCVGYAITSIRSIQAARALAWSHAILAVPGMALFCNNEPAGFRMFAIIGTLLYAMKAVVAVEAQADGGKRLPPLRWFGFAMLWPGMQPSLFQKRAPRPLPATEYFIRGIAMTALGLVLTAASRWLWLHRIHLGPVTPRIIATVVLLPGLSLILHFGLFNLITACWRRAGFDCRALFRAPFLSKSLSEFWGKRWNLAFSQMSAIGVYRPLVRRIGPRGAALAAFLFSGLLHEIAISVPVMAGFGLPLAYFALHGLLVALERQMEAQGHPISRHAWLGRTWVIAWLAAPAAILFHPWFLRGVVWPLIGIK